jgi:hypothetical protein
VPWALTPVTDAPGVFEIVNPAGNTEATVWPDHSLLHPDVRHELGQLIHRLNDLEQPMCRLCGMDGGHRCDG